MDILSKGYKPDNFESHNLALRTFEVFVQILLNVNLSLNQTLLTFLLNFSVRGYLPLIQKDSFTHMHDLAVYVKKGLPFARDIYLENSADSYLCFRLALLHQCPTSFSSNDHLLHLYAQFLMLFHVI